MSRYDPARSENAMDTSVSPQPYLVFQRGVRMVPTVKMTPSTQRLAKKEAATIAHPYPPQVNDYRLIQAIQKTYPPF